MNFYEQTANVMPKLSSGEHTIMTYVVKNLHVVKNMSIRDLAAECFVSTTTIFRFVKKLGYEGYNEFIEAIAKTEEDTRKISIPSIVNNDNYRDSYLKNIVEAVKVITDEKINKFHTIMSKNPHIYILAQGFSKEVARYFVRLFTSFGFTVDFPCEPFEFEACVRRIKREDVLLVLSFKGENEKLIHEIERVYAVATPAVISLTRADNNAIQNMSDLNFYVFADQISYENNDVTSRIGMIAIMETLLYKHMSYK